MEALLEKTEEPQITDFLRPCVTSSEATAKILLPEHFEVPFSDLHRRIMRLIDDDSARKVAICASRGFGKTSIVVKGLIARSILFGLRNYVVYVTTTETNAVMWTENLKRALISDEIIRKAFGNIKTSAYKFAGMEESFSKKHWVANTPYGQTCILPRGDGQQIRGLCFGHYRPDLIVIDDLEDTETIENEDIRRKRKIWFYGDLMKAVDRFSHNWKLVYIDTLKHQDGLMAELLESSSWKSDTISIDDGSHHSLVPNLVSTEDLQTEVAEHRENKTLDVYYREIMCLPISTEDAVFRQEYFKYYDEAELKSDRKRSEAVENVILLDPASTTKVHSDDSAIVCAGVDIVANKYYFRDCVSGKMHPDEIYDEALKMAERFGARVIGIEVTALNEFLIHPFKNEMLRRGRGYQVVELRPRAKKSLRIAALAPYYRLGQIYHNQGVSGQLEAQLMGFPRAKRDDVADAFAYFIELLELGERYFLNNAKDPYGSEEEFRELEELDSEPALAGWRMC